MSYVYIASAISGNVGVKLVDRGRTEQELLYRGPMNIDKTIVKAGDWLAWLTITSVLTVL